MHRINYSVRKLDAGFSLNTFLLIAITGAKVSKSDRSALFSAALSGIRESIIRPFSSLAGGVVIPKFIILYFLVNLVSKGVFIGQIHY